VFRLVGFGSIGLVVIAVLLIARTSMEARAVPELAPPATAANAAEPDALPLAKADRLPPPDFVVRMPVVSVEPTPSIANTRVSKPEIRRSEASRTEVSKPEIRKSEASKTEASKTEASKTEAITTWHWRAGSKKIHKSTSAGER
jgi:hypothetical protein